MLLNFAIFLYSLLLTLSHIEHTVLLQVILFDMFRKNSLLLRWFIIGVICHNVIVCDHESGILSEGWNLTLRRNGGTGLLAGHDRFTHVAATWCWDYDLLAVRRMEMDVDVRWGASIFLIFISFAIPLPEFGFLNQFTILGAAKFAAVSLEDFPTLNYPRLNLLSRATTAIQVGRDFNDDLIGLILILAGRKLALSTDFDCRYDRNFAAFGRQICQVGLSRVMHTILNG